MNSSAELSPSYQLLLVEIRKLFAEYAPSIAASVAPAPAPAPVASSTAAASTAPAPAPTSFVCSAPHSLPEEQSVMGVDLHDILDRDTLDRESLRDAAATTASSGATSLAGPTILNSVSKIITAPATAATFPAAPAPAASAAASAAVYDTASAESDAPSFALVLDAAATAVFPIQIKEGEGDLEETEMDAFVEGTLAASWPHRAPPLPPRPRRPRQPPLRVAWLRRPRHAPPRAPRLRRPRRAYLRVHRLRRQRRPPPWPPRTRRLRRDPPFAPRPRNRARLGPHTLAPRRRNGANQCQGMLGSRVPGSRPHAPEATRDGAPSARAGLARPRRRPRVPRTRSRFALLPRSPLEDGPRAVRTASPSTLTTYLRLGCPNAGQYALRRVVTNPAVHFVRLGSTHHGYISEEYLVPEEEDVFTTTPTRCSTIGNSRDTNMLEQVDTIITIQIAPPILFPFTSGSVLEINKCFSFKSMGCRYITNSTPASSFHEVCLAIRVLDVYGEMGVQKSVMQQSVLAALVDKDRGPYILNFERVDISPKLPWPPPIQHQMQYVGVQLRPTHWPSFDCHPVVQLVEFWSMLSGGSVFGILFGLIQSCQHVLLVGLRCYRLQGTRIRTVELQSGTFLIFSSGDWLLIDCEHKQARWEFSLLSLMWLPMGDSGGVSGVSTLHILAHHNIAHVHLKTSLNTMRVSSCQCHFNFWSLICLSWVVMQYKPSWPPPQSNGTLLQLSVSFGFICSWRRSTVPSFHCVCSNARWPVMHVAEYLSLASNIAYWCLVVLKLEMQIDTTVSLILWSHAYIISAISFQGTMLYAFGTCKVASEPFKYIVAFQSFVWRRLAIDKVSRQCCYTQIQSSRNHVSYLEYWKFWVKLLQIVVQIAETINIKCSCSWFTKYTSDRLMQLTSSVLFGAMLVTQPVILIFCWEEPTFCHAHIEDAALVIIVLHLFSTKSFCLSSISYD